LHRRIEVIMKPHSMQTLLAAALAAIALNIGAQTTTVPPAGAATEQNRAQAPTSSGSYQSGPSSYIEARRACDNQPMAQRMSCEDAVNERFTGIDPKCQKLSGTALEECVHGADRGS
jgi:hypothetical protein